MRRKRGRRRRGTNILNSTSTSWCFQRRYLGVRSPLPQLSNYKKKLVYILVVNKLSIMYLGWGEVRVDVGKCDKLVPCVSDMKFPGCFTSHKNNFIYSFLSFELET